MVEQTYLVRIRPPSEAVQHVRAATDVNGVESARHKVVRAGEHLQSLEDKAATYLSDHQSNFVIEESNGEQQLRFVKDPPTEIAILAGEIVYQLRSALIHLAFELVKSNPIASLPEDPGDDEFGFIQSLFCVN